MWLVATVGQGGLSNLTLQSCLAGVQFSFVPEPDHK